MRSRFSGLSILLLAGSGILATPAVAADLYATRVKACGVRRSCTPVTEIVRIDLGNPTAAPSFVARGGSMVAAFDPKGPRIFFTFPHGWGSTALSVADLGARLTGRFPGVDTNWTTFAFDGSSRSMYDVRLTELRQTDLESGASTTILPLDGLSDLLAVDGARQRVYVADHSTDEQTRIRIVDLARGMVSDTVMPLPGVTTPAIVIDADGSAFIFAEAGVGTVNVFRFAPATNTVTTVAASVLMEARRVVLDPTTRIAYGTGIENGARVIVAFDLLTGVSRVLLHRPPPSDGDWAEVAGVSLPARARSVRAR